MKKGPKFSTFSGVFVPSVLAILGAVMYYIAPKVTGGVGLLRMIAIIVIAHSITLATAFSISSIATNINVKGGGLYYLISRSLGTEFGGSIGIQLFLAQTIAVSFYALAFSRAVTAILAELGINIAGAYIAAIAILFFMTVVLRGASFVIRIQYFILAAILLSIISIFLGTNTVQGQAFTTMPSISFWVAFAMFFPAVTGIDAGVGMSGELRDPKKSLVSGTFVSIIFTMLIYIALAVKFVFAAPAGELAGNPYVIHEIALFPEIVILGVLLATSSSALSCLMTAPRTLRAMTKDRIFSKRLLFLGGNIGYKDEPRVAIILSSAIALWAIFWGNLELVAQIVAIFFLNVYGWINGAAFFEKLSNNPSYRPSFHSPLIMNFYGMLACYAVMYLFNPWVMIAGLAFQVIVFYALVKTKKSYKVEGVWRGVLFQILRRALNEVEHSHKTKKNWRPTILGVCANNKNKTIIATMLHWLNSKRSVSKLYILESGKLSPKRKKRERLECDMQNYTRKKHIDLFTRAIISDHFRTTIKTLLQSETLGNLAYNTVFLDFDPRFKMKKIIKDTRDLNKNLMILRNNRCFKRYHFIDVWWNNADNGNLMILLAHLISNSEEWKKHNPVIRLFKVANTKAKKESERAKIKKMIAQSRIDNISIRIVRSRGHPLHKTIDRYSGYSDLVLIGLPDTGKKRSKDITNTIKRYTENLNVSLVCLANDKIDFKVN